MSLPPALLAPLPQAGLAPSVHPGVPRTGAMLPTTPLHRLLCDRFGGPLVCTSGNRSDEPICRDAVEAAARLGQCCGRSTTRSPGWWTARRC